MRLRGFKRLRDLIGKAGSTQESATTLSRQENQEPKSTEEPDQAPSVLRIDGWTCGAFAAIHHMAEVAFTAHQDGHKVVVKWDSSCYKDPEHPGNPWRYYFEPMCPGAKLGKNPKRAREQYPGEQLEHGSMFAPRLVGGQRDSRGLPTDRAFARDVLNRFVRLNATTQRFVDDFANTYFDRPVIGLHLRGAGGIHGGALEARQMIDASGGVPYEHYFQAVDAALETHPDALVFGCSDSNQVIEQIRARYPGRSVVYPSSRSDFGEMHADHPENEGLSFSPYKLGLDVIVEAHLLARSVHFVHGNSHVSNHVLCLAPEMPNTYVYAEFEERVVEVAKARKRAKEAEAGNGSDMPA